MLVSSGTCVLLLGGNGSFNFSSTTLGISFVNFKSGFAGPWPILFNKVSGLVLADVVPVVKEFSGCNKVSGENSALGDNCVSRAVDFVPSSSSSTDGSLPVLEW